MADFDWKAIVRTVAPAMATAVGTPAAGAVVAALSNAIFGNPDAPQDQIATVIRGQHLTPDQLAAIARADNDFKAQMAQIAAETERSYIADTSDARQQTIELAKADSPLAWGAAIVSTLIVCGFFAAVYLLFFIDKAWDERTANLLNVLFGALTVSFTQVGNYWLGSSAGSKRASDSIRKIAEQAKR